MRWFHVLLTISVLFCGGCAAATPVYTDDGAAEPTGSDDRELAKAEKKKDQKICYFERPLGSNLPKKVCFTKRSNAERRNDDMRSIEKVRLRGVGTP